MSSAGKFRIGLNLRKKPEEESGGEAKKKPSEAVASAFGADSDEDAEESAAAKFERKYAGSANTKARDQRLIEKEMAENPEIFDYDAHYEQIQQQRDQKVAAQKEADKEKKPKYAHLLHKAHKQRELNKLLVEENTYKKEREKEAGQFEDKEVFITGAYRQQIEERTRHKAEMEKEEALEKLRDVRDQKMWQQAFHRTMLDNRARDFVEPPSLADVKPEVKSEMTGEGEEKEMKMEETEPEEEEPQTEQQQKEIKREEEHSTCGSGQYRSQQHHRGDNEQQYKHAERGDRRRQHSPRSPQVDDQLRRTRSPPQDKRPRRERSEQHKEMSEEERRMERIREILKRRNDERAIEEARERYLERRAGGEIVAPI